MQRRRFVMLALASAPQLVLGAPLAPEAESLVRRRLRFTLTFTNPQQQDLADQLFACYLPAESGPAQRLHKVDVSMDHRIETDSLGHRVLLLPFASFPRLGQKIVSLNAEVHCMPAAAQPAARSQWLGPERFIESDTTPVRTLAATLKHSDDMQTARRIYDTVRTRLAYAGYVSDDRGALDALESGSGDCTEYAYLVVALARACGIAARMVGGYVVDRDSAPRSQEYHNWAELYLDGAWRMVDAQKENWLTSAAQYIVYRIYRDAPTNSVGLAHRYLMRGQLAVKL